MKWKHRWTPPTLGLVSVAVALLLTSCAGGSGSDTSSDKTNVGQGWVIITSPTTEQTYPTDTSPIYISGEAFISPNSGCCSSDVSMNTGVTVTWRDETTGHSGEANQYNDYCWFPFLYPWVCGHTWSIHLPIASGEHRITVTASDRLGNRGTATLTIIRSEDTNPPSIVLTDPASGATGVDPGAQLVAVFSESVDPETVTPGSFLIETLAGNPISGSTDLSGPGTRATFTPLVSFAANGTYIATLTTAISDLSGHTLSADYSWTFETGEGDTVPPTITFTSPSAGATDVSLNATISVHFSEPISELSITPDTFLLFDSANNRVDGAVAAFPGESATFTPSAPLEQTALYTARISTGVTDLTGNSLENDYSWSFTTALPDTIAPMVTNTFPADNETGVAIDGDLVVEFSEEMDRNTINASTFILEDSRGTPFSGDVYNGNTFRPYAHLGLAETYTAIITTGATDLAGNPLAQPYSWAFTTTENGIGSWTPTSNVTAPSPREDAVAVWTGQEMIIWGGDNGTYLNSGARYRPVTDSWQPISTVNAPGGCSTPVAVWTGQEMIVWCGRVTTGARGGRYNPVTDTWASISTLNAPGGLSHSTAVWTGSEMIVWGGYGSAYSNTGGRYDPATDTWQRTSTSGAPAGRVHHTAVWTGSEMIVWGGDGGPFVYIGDTGGRYDPVTDTWNSCSPSGFVDNKVGHVATWTGSTMVVWSGNSNSGNYDPVTDSWNAIAPLGSLVDRNSPLSVWTGQHMIVWGGGNLPAILNSGGSYSPSTNSWNLMSFTEAPSGRSGGIGVWTGSEFIVWGGRDWSGALSNAGARYRFP